MTIAERARGRDNNFNFVRLLAAGLVLVSHSWPLTATPGEPLEGFADFSLGHLGVDIFFVVSGFLVTGSLLARPLPSFLRARALRIFPALFANAFGTALVIGPLVTALPLDRYFGAWDTWRYALQNSVTWPLGVRWWLPGVFPANPAGPAVNGALWSLPWELTMYAMLACLGFLWLRARASDPAPRESGGERPAGRGARPVPRPLRVAVFALAGAATLAHGVNEALSLTTRFELVQGFRLVALFFGAAALQLVSGRVPLRAPLALAALAALPAVLALKGAWLALYPVALGYLVTWLALVPGGVLRLYNRLGDYSYGFYLWQFPLQQWIVLRRPETSQPELVLLSAPAALAVAALSWHLVEAPALARKERG